MHRNLGTRLAIALVAASVALSIESCSGGKKPDIVVIVLDTARPDYLSVYGHTRPTTPFLETFAKTGVRYDRAYSTSSWTLPAHASLFTGMPPEIHQAQQKNPKLSPELPVLSERLGKAGYQTIAVSNNAWVAKHTGLARGFDTFQERRDTVEGAQGGAEGVHPTVQAVSRWLDEERDPQKPYFLFVNLIEPHMPYRPPFEAAEPFISPREVWQASMQAFFPAGQSPAFTTNRHYSRKRPLDDDEWARLRALYEGELRATDAIVQQIVARVDQASDPKNTLVFLLSDHGENLGDHGHITHVFNLYDTNLKIALLARGPGLAPGTQEKKLVQIVDLYPTILRAAGLEPEPGITGIDLRGKLPEARLLSASLDYPKLSFDTFSQEIRASGALDPYKRELSAVISARYKVIRASNGPLEIYDLIADPGETKPLSTDAIDAVTLKGLVTFLDVSAAKATTHVKSSELTQDPAVLKALKALGYVE
jgi:arylsulfatase A-like enzyme